MRIDVKRMMEEANSGEEFMNNIFDKVAFDTISEIITDGQVLCSELVSKELNADNFADRFDKVTGAEGFLLNIVNERMEAVLSAMEAEPEDGSDVVCGNTRIIIEN